MRPHRALQLLVVLFLAACSEPEPFGLFGTTVHFERYGLAFDYPEALVVNVKGEPPQHIVTVDGPSFRMVLQDFPAGSITVEEAERRDPVLLEESQQQKVVGARDGEPLERMIAGAVRHGRRYRLPGEAGKIWFEIFYVPRNGVITKLILRSDDPAERAGAERAFSTILFSLR